MGYDEDRVDEMTLALMHLVKHRQRSDGPLRAWKGFDWDTLDRLHEKGFISDPKSKAKSVRLTEEGAEASLELFEEFFVEDGEGREEGSEGDERIVDPEWRDREWRPDLDGDHQTVELTEQQFRRLASGTSDDGYTVWVDVEDGEIGELFEPEIEAGMISPDEDREERRRQIRERREGLKADDAVVVIREESEQEAWRDMESFCEYVEDDQFRELLDIAVHGKGAFGQFRDALSRRAGVRDLWREYKGQRRRWRVRDQLAAEGYVIRVVESE